MRKLPLSLVEIVTILNDGQYHDGDTIGSQLNITRAAVWKAIQKLESYGISVDSKKHKGYILPERLILLDENYIKNNLREHSIDIELFESIDSTNAYLKKYFDNNQQKIRICIAEHQTAGRGRLNRSWVSPFGKNLYLSCLYPFAKDIAALAGLTLVVGLAIIDALKRFNLPQPALLKWPNDVVCDGQKLAGSLIDIRAEANGLSYAIIGIGLNVNMADAQEITRPWTSLKKIMQQDINRNELCVCLIDSLLNYMQKFALSGFEPFIEEWQKFDSLAGKYINLQDGGSITSGIAKGINNQGNLLIELANGTIKAFSVGDATLHTRNA